MLDNTQPVLCIQVTPPKSDVLKSDFRIVEVPKIPNTFMHKFSFQSWISVSRMNSISER